MVPVSLSLTRVKGIPTGTAIQQPPTVPELVPGTVTVAFYSIKATFADGLTPVIIDPDHGSKCSPAVTPLEHSILVTWYKPTRPAWLDFDSLEKAAHAKDLLDKKEIHGAVPKAKLERSGSSSREIRVWTVAVTGLLAETTKDDLYAIFEQEQRPKKVFLGVFNYPPQTSGMEEVRKHIRMRTGSAINREENHRRKNPLKICTEFFFVGNPDTERLAKELNGFAIPEMGNTKVFAEPSLHLELTITAKLCGAEDVEVRQFVTESWTKWHVKIRLSVPKSSVGRVAIQLFASSRQSLVAAKQRLDSILSSDEDMYYINLVPNASRHRIRLTKTTAYLSVKRTFHLAEQEFGKDVVTFDEDSNPPAILVQGDATVLRRVQKLFRGDEPTPKSKTTARVICMDDEAEDFVRIDGCGHTACVECVAQYCVQSEPNFPLQCFQVSCTRELTLGQLHMLLSADKLRAVMAKSLRDYIQRHPNEFAKCPGEKCTKTYRKTSAVSAGKLCHECLTNFCSCCNVEYHVGMTCQEYQREIVEAERGTLRWMEENGGKRCPSCRAAVEKAVGCNNMECRLCRAHFCWICLEIAATHEGVYRHLIEQHGGYYDDPQAEVDRIIQNMGPEEAALNGVAGAAFAAAVHDVVFGRHGLGPIAAAERPPPPPDGVLQPIDPNVAAQPPQERRERLQQQARLRERDQNAMEALAAQLRQPLMRPRALRRQVDPPVGFGEVGAVPELPLHPLADGQQPPPQANAIPPQAVGAADAAWGAPPPPRPRADRADEER